MTTTLQPMIATVPNRGSARCARPRRQCGRVFWHPTTSQLYTHALARGEAQLAEGGPLVVDTGEHTGRSPKDKLVVREPGSEDRIWWSDVNAEISEELVRAAARQADGPPRAARRLRRRRLRGRRSRASDRRARDHREPLARALRQDPVHRPGAGRARRDGDRRARPARASLVATRRRTGRGAARSSSSTRRVPRC